MPLAVDNVIKIEFGGRQTSSQTRWMVTHFVEVQANSSSDSEYVDLAAIAEFYAGDWDTYWNPYLDSSTFLDVVRAQRVAPTPSVIAFYLAGTAGAVSGNSVEPNSSILVSLKSGHAGRSGIGRRYIPGCPSASAVDGLISITEAGEFGLAAEAVFLSAGTPPGMTLLPTIFSPTLFAEAGALETYSFPVEDVFIDRVLRRQDRRDYKVPQPATSSE